MLRNFSLIALFFACVFCANLREEQLDYSRVYHDDEDDNWDTGSLGNVSYAISGFITVLSKEEFIQEYQNDSSIFEEVADVKSFFRDMTLISKGEYINLLIHFIYKRYVAQLRLPNSVELEEQPSNKLQPDSS